MNDYLKTKELYHHGIKGQKWGVRRYQNEDGTLTEEGLARTKAAQETLKGTENIAKTAQTFTTDSRGTTAIRKDYSDLSNEELQKRVNRLNLERSYGDLTGDTKYVKTGKEKVREWLQTIGAIVGIAGSAVGIYRALHAPRNTKNIGNS